MNEQTEAGQGPQLETTKHSATVRSRDGGSVSLSRADQAELHALTITRPGAGAQLTAWLRQLDLKALLTDSHQCCGNCHFSRLDPSGRELRCHRNTPRKRGDEVYFPRLPSGEWCGKYRSMVSA